MPEKIRGGVQEIVDSYKTLAIVIRVNKHTAFYEVEVYNRGVKMIIGKDILFYMALVRALKGIIKLIDDKAINKFTELKENEVNKLIAIINELSNEDVEIYVPSSFRKIMESQEEIDWIR